jgi:hypothetical protein
LVQNTQEPPKDDLRSLKELMKDIPDALTSYNILIELTDPPQNQAAIDRNIAIVGTAFLEIGLKQAITKHLRRDLSGDDYENMILSIFDDYDRSPLATFSLRIKMAFALGIIDNRTRDDFEKIRKLRNAFAHVPSTIRLDTPSLADSINSLSPPPHGPTQRAWGNMGPRLRFASSMFVYFWSLSNYSLDLEASQQNSSP